MKKRMQKEQEDLKREGKGLAYAAFFLTLTSMALALSFIPFLPQPLPLIVALLVAFLVYVNPRGMALGCLPIGLGVLYQLSTQDFIAMLGNSELRVFVISLILFFFVALPIRFRSYEDAISINVGIIAATLLFFDATYFLAIPLVLTAAVFFKRTQVSLAVGYYTLVSTPLMILQYYEHILTINRWDFWNNPTAVPPIYVSLSKVFISIHATMPRLNVPEAYITLGWIGGQITKVPPVMIHTGADAVGQYVNSLPGITLFIAIVAGLVMAAALILPQLTSQTSSIRGEILFPFFVAVGVTAIFFLFLTGLQHPLAFSTQIDGSRIVLGTLSTIFFAVPPTLLSYAPKRKREIEKNSKIIMAKAQDLLRKLQPSEELVGKVKDSIPVDVKATEVNIEVIKDKLNSILTHAAARRYKLPELYGKIKELNGDLTNGVNSIWLDLITALEQYQINLNYEYKTWTKKLQEIGYNVKDPVKIDFQKEQTPEERINYISTALAASRLLAKEVCQRTEEIYDVLKSLFDPRLPSESRTVAYVEQKLSEKSAPWDVCGALIASLNSWKKQYGAEISKSKLSLQHSLASLVLMKAQAETLQSVLGEKFKTVMNELEKAEETKTELEKKTIDILNITVFSDALQSTLSIAKTVLSILYEELKTKEESIERLQPIENYFWEKDVTLREQMASAIEKISNLKKYKPHQIKQNLPQAFAYVDQCVRTIAQYNNKNELLLNYPVAKTAIEDLLKKKKNISIQDLPFGPKNAEEYLKLFYNEKQREFTFDQENLLLIKKS